MLRRRAVFLREHFPDHYGILVDPILNPPSLVFVRNP